MGKSLFDNIRIKELEILLGLSSSPEKFLLRKKDFHKKLKFGDIICPINFTTRKDFFGKAVMKLTKSRVTHAEIYVGRGKIIDSYEKRGFVDYENLFDMKGQILVVLRADLKPSQKRKLHNLIHEILKNKPKYNSKGVLGHAVYRVTGFFPKWLNSQESFFCSELVYELYLKAGHKLGEHKNSSFVSPTDLFESKKLKMVYLLDGVRGMNFARKTRDANNKIQEEAKKLLLMKLR